MNITKALYDVLVADVDLAGRLATYNGEPAIFTIDPIPQNATFPAVIISGSDTDDDYGAKNEDARSVVRTIRTYADADVGTTSVVDDIAERLRSLLHRQPFAVAGGVVYLVDVQGPLSAPSTADLHGRRVVVRFAVTSAL